jgi:hypothetical protein
MRDDPDEIVTNRTLTTILDKWWNNKAQNETPNLPNINSTSGPIADPSPRSATKSAPSPRPSYVSDDSGRPAPSSDITDDYVDDCDPPSHTFSAPLPLPLEFGTHRTTYESLYSEIFDINGRGNISEHIQGYVHDELFSAHLDEEAIDRTNINDVDLPTDSDTEYNGPIPYHDDRTSKQQQTTHPVATLCQSPSEKSNSSPCFAPCDPSVSSVCKLAAKGTPPKGTPIAYAQPPPNETPIASVATSPPQAAASVPAHGHSPRPPCAPPKAAARAVKAECQITAESASQRPSEDDPIDQYDAAVVGSDTDLGARAPFDPCRYCARGRCHQGLHCLFYHDEASRNTRDQDNPNFAKCSAHGHRRKKSFMICTDGSWHCNPDDNESYCHRERSDQKRPKTLPPPPGDAPIPSGPVSKAAMRQPIPNRAPRGATAPKKASPAKETTAAKRPVHRSRSPCASRSRNPKAFTEGIEKRDRSQSRKSEDQRSSRSTSSSNKRNNNKKTTPKSRSRSRAQRAQSPQRDRRTTSRTAFPKPPPCEDRAVKKLGMHLNCTQPKCELGHVLSYPSITHLAPYVQPQCRYCPRRFIKGSSICVCHQCEPMFVACVRCTFNLPNTDDDTN